MKTAEFKVTVIDREACVEGLIFKRRAYYITLRFETSGHVERRRVPLQQYYEDKVGDVYFVTLYGTDDGESWFFSEKEAHRAGVW